MYQSHLWLKFELRRKIILTSHRCQFQALESRVMLSGGAEDPVLQLFSAAPAVFVQNEGQWPDPAVRFAYQNQGGSVAITDQGPVFRLTQPVASETPSNGPAGIGQLDLGSQEVRQTTFSARFENSNTVVPLGADPSQTSFNFLIGDASQHRSNVLGFETIVYPGLYSGIDLQLEGDRGALKYEFHVAPDADTDQIQIAWDGVGELSLDDDGNLHIQTDLGTIVDPKPFIYQEVGGQRVEVTGRYAFKSGGDGSYGFEITGGYDRGLPLVIDPVLDWSTYLGGNAVDHGSGIALDSAGNAYVTGYTLSAGWATTGFDTSYNGNNDVFVAKLNPTGTSLFYMTYLGGNGDDMGYSIAGDNSGNVYVTGDTTSTGWATNASLDSTYNGGQDAFVAKLNSTGTSLIYVAYLGGSGDDHGKGIAVDSVGNAYVTGSTTSSDWATNSSFDVTYNGGSYYGDAFVAKLNATGDSLVYMTYLGGGGDDHGLSIAVDSTRSVYVTGDTTSSGWATGGSYDTQFGGGDYSDAFVAKLNAAGTNLLYMTYLGGNGYDEGSGIAVDNTGNAYVTGGTNLSGWATTGAYDSSFNGGIDVFVAKLDSTGAGLLYLTYLGGSGYEQGSGIAIDGAGGAYVTGHTNSSDWATVGSYDTTINGSDDTFVAKVDSTGTSLLYMTYLGGTDGDYGYGIAVDESRNVYVTGETRSSGWATAGSYDTHHEDYEYDAFVAKINVVDTFAPAVNLTYYGSTTFQPGALVTVYLEAQNSGNLTADAVITLEVFGPDLTWPVDVNDLKVFDSHAMGKDVITSLGAGQTRTYSFSFTLPFDAPLGQYTILGAIRTTPYDLDSVVLDTTGPATAMEDWTSAAYVLGFQVDAARPESPIIPALSSRPGAAFTIYLDFDKFVFPGMWLGNYTFANALAYDIDGDTSTFSVAELDNIREIWSRVAEEFSAFNINVTTVDPAIAGGAAESDLARQNYYDSQARMMHTVVYWGEGPGGITSFGSMADSQTLSFGWHTNWVGTGFDLPFRVVADTATVAAFVAHENGHALGLNHQADFDGNTLITDYSNGTDAGAPIMGYGFPARPLWAVGTTVPDAVIQNDLQILANNRGLGGFVEDGIGHTIDSATLLPAPANTIDYTLAKGTIHPRNSANPNPSGTENYTPDWWSFGTAGGVVTINAVSGRSTISPNMADPGATLNIAMSIYDSNLNLLSTVATSDLNETYSSTLSSGTYYIKIQATGDAVDNTYVSRSFYDIGDYFLTGTIPSYPYASVTAANIAIGGATGTGAAYKIGDIVTASWDNTASGDNNSALISAVAMDFSQFGGGTASAINNGNIWTATYAISSGAIDAVDRNVSVMVRTTLGSLVTTTIDDANISVDNRNPVTSSNIGLSGATGLGGAFRVGDIVHVTWNNTNTGDNNLDTLVSVVADMSQIGGGHAVTMTNTGGVYSASYPISLGMSDVSGATVAVIVTDNAGNTNTATGQGSATVNAINDAPSFQKGADIVVVKNSGAFSSQSAWATAMAAGPANESGQQLSFILSGFSGESFSVQPAIDPSTGVLSFTPAPDFFGAVTITATLRDNGGTDNGGIDAFAQTFTLATSLQFGAVGTQKNVKIIVPEADGTKGTFSLTGNGTGALIPKIDGSFDVAIVNANAKTTLKIAPDKAGGGTFNLGSITVDDTSGNESLGKIDAKTTNLSGDLLVTGSIASIALGNVNGPGTIDIGAPASSKNQVTIAVGKITDMSINSATPIKSLSTIDWNDTDGIADAITAPWIGTLSIIGSKSDLTLGDFEADLNLSGSNAPKGVSLSKMSAFGSLSESSWSILAGSIGSVTVGGTIRLSTVRVLSNIGAITAGAIVDSAIFAGVADGLTTLPTAFANPSATISSLTVKGLTSAASFTRSLVAAGVLTKVSLKIVDPAGGAGTTGFAADKVKSYSRTGLTKSLANLDTANANNDPTLGNDYVLRTV